MSESGSRRRRGPPGVELADPGPGRVYRSRGRVRTSDIGASGRVRLEAVARYLQDAAADDVRDAGVEGLVTWVVRRTTIVARDRPTYGEELELATWCSGTGAAWAERRTTIQGDRGSAIEAVSLWVSLDPLDLRPVPLDGDFFKPYREAAGSRRVRSKLLLPGPPPTADSSRLWPLRWSDLDAFGHVNNVVSWAAVEEEVNNLAPGASFEWGEVEYRQPIESDDSPSVVAKREGNVISVWILTAGESAATSARVGVLET